MAKHSEQPHCTYAETAEGRNREREQLGFRLGRQSPILTELCSFSRVEGTERRVHGSLLDNVAWRTRMNDSYIHQDTPSIQHDFDIRTASLPVHLRFDECWQLDAIAPSRKVGCDRVMAASQRRSRQPRAPEKVGGIILECRRSIAAWASGWQRVCGVYAFSLFACDGQLEIGQLG